MILATITNSLRRSSLSGCKRKIRAWERQGSRVDAETLDRVSRSLNSYLGMLRQVNGYRARKALSRLRKGLRPEIPGNALTGATSSFFWGCSKARAPKTSGAPTVQEGI